MRAGHTWTTADFDQLCWHDNYLHGLYLDYENHELILDIDYIVSWPACGEGQPVEFGVCPSTLRFHDVRRLRIEAELMDVLAMSIGEIVRSEERSWQVVLNWPVRAPAITFAASGFTQVAREGPVIVGPEQHLPFSRRSRI